MAQPPPPAFQAQTVANAFTNIGNHFVALQNESNTLVQEFALLGNAAPIALVQLTQTCNQLTQTCNQILQTVQTHTQDLVELKAQSHNLRARLANSGQLNSLHNAIDPLHALATNLPIPHFPATLAALRGLWQNARNILTALRVPWANNTSVADLRNRLRIEIGCREPA